MIAYHCGIEPLFTSELEEFRRRSFRTHWLVGSSEDEFDALAFHLTIRRDGTLVAALRVLRGPQLFVDSWATKLPEVLRNDKMTEISRLVGHRNLGMAWASAHLLACECLLFSASLGAEQVVATKDANDQMLPFLFSLGFHMIGSPFEAIVPPRSEPVRCVLFGIEVCEMLPRIIAVRQHCINLLEAHSSSYYSTIQKPDQIPNVNIESEIGQWLKARAQIKHDFR